MIEIAIGIASFSAGVLCMGIFAAGRSGDVCAVSDDWHTITRLTGELSDWQKSANNLGEICLETNAKLQAALAENADLRIDIAAKAQRLADAGLQSSGGIDPTVSA